MGARGGSGLAAPAEGAGAAGGPGGDASAGPPPDSRGAPPDSARGPRLFCLEYEGDDGQVTAVIVHQVRPRDPGAGNGGGRTGLRGDGGSVGLGVGAVGMWGF